MRELLPGVHRIETEMGTNLLCVYVLRGERTLLVDSGLRTTPEAAVFPALAAAGLPEHIELLLVSHGDADHHGGNAAVRARSPLVTILCHDLDRPRVESRERHLHGRYDAVVESDDMQYPEEIMTWLADMIGADTPVDRSLYGGETLDLGHGMRYETLHTPGHTAGHLSLWNPEPRVLILQDAVLGRGVPDREGNVLSPPPYYDVGAYRDTIRRLEALDAHWLLTAHYPVMRGDAVAPFFAESYAYVEQIDTAVLETLHDRSRPLTLSAVIDALDARLGPFAVKLQWIGPALAHLCHHADAGRLREGTDGKARTWELV